MESQEALAIEVDKARITRNKIRGEPIIQGKRITVRDIVEYQEIYQSKERILKGAV